MVYCSFVRLLSHYASPLRATLSFALSDEMESIRRRAFKIVCPTLPYADALVVTRLDTLINRTDVACNLFFHRIKGPKTHFRNPVEYIVKERSQEPSYDYFLRNQNKIRSPLLIRTKRFRNFVAVTYNT